MEFTLTEAQQADLRTRLENTDSEVIIAVEEDRITFSGCCFGVFVAPAAPVIPESAREAVAKGAELLDARRAYQWRDRLDLDRLDLDSVSDCVLGQLFSHDPTTGEEVYDGYSAGKDLLGLDTRAASDLGFTDAFASHTNDDLDAAWKELLSLRGEEGKELFS